MPCELKSLAYFALLFLSLFPLSFLSLFFGPALSFLVAACKEEVKSPFYFFFSIFFLLLPGRSFVCLVFPFGCFFFLAIFFCILDCTCVWLENYKKSALNWGRGGAWHAVGVLFTYASVFSIVRRAKIQRGRGGQG